MLRTKKKAAVIRAHTVALQLQRPSIRICADIIEPHGIPFEDVREHALTDTGDELYLLGEHYESLLKPHAERHLQRLGLPYHAVDVDGLLRNGRINIGVWMTKPEIDMVAPKDYERALNDVSILEVMDKPSPEQMKRDLTDEQLRPHNQCAKFLEIPFPNLLKIVYQIGFGKIIPDSGPKGYMIMPPHVFEYYTGKPPPQFYADMFAKQRRDAEGHRRFREQTYRDFDINGPDTSFRRR